MVGLGGETDLHDGVGNGQADIRILCCQNGAHLQGNTYGFTVQMSVPNNVRRTVTSCTLAEGACMGLTLPAFQRQPARMPGRAEALGKRLQGAWPARMRPMVTKGTVTRTPNAMLGTKGIPVASSRA